MEEVGSEREKEQRRGLQLDGEREAEGQLAQRGMRELGMEELEELEERCLDEEWKSQEVVARSRSEQEGLGGEGREQVMLNASERRGREGEKEMQRKVGREGGDWEKPMQSELKGVGRVCRHRQRARRILDHLSFPDANSAAAGGVGGRDVGR